MSLRKIFTEALLRLVGIVLFVYAVVQVGMSISSSLPENLREPVWTVMIAFVILFILLAYLAEWITRQLLIRRLGKQITRFAVGYAEITLPDDTYGSISLVVLSHGDGIVMTLGTENTVVMILDKHSITRTWKITSRKTGSPGLAQVVVRREKISQDEFVRSVPRYITK